MSGANATEVTPWKKIASVRTYPTTLSCETKHLSNGFRKSTPPHNRRLQSQLPHKIVDSWRGTCPTREREFFIDNLLVRIHYIVAMIR